MSVGACCYHIEAGTLCLVGNDKCGDGGGGLGDVYFLVFEASGSAGKRKGLDGG